LGPTFAEGEIGYREVYDDLRTVVPAGAVCVDWRIDCGAGD
jgi:hypothetical protein